MKEPEVQELIKLEENIYSKVGTAFDEIKEQLIGGEILQLQMMEVE